MPLKKSKAPKKRRCSSITKVPLGSADTLKADERLHAIYALALSRKPWHLTLSDLEKRFGVCSTPFLGALHEWSSSSSPPPDAKTVLELIEEVYRARCPDSNVSLERRDVEEAVRRYASGYLTPVVRPGKRQRPSPASLESSPLKRMRCKGIDASGENHRRSCAPSSHGPIVDNKVDEYNQDDHVPNQVHSQESNAGNKPRMVNKHHKMSGDSSLIEREVGSADVDRDTPNPDFNEESHVRDMGNEHHGMPSHGMPAERDLEKVNEDGAIPNQGLPTEDGLLKACEGDDIFAQESEGQREAFTANREGSNLQVSKPSIPSSYGLTLLSGDSDNDDDTRQPPCVPQYDLTLLSDNDDEVGPIPSASKYNLNQLEPGQWLGHNIIYRLLQVVDEEEVALYDPGNLERLSDLDDWPKKRRRQPDFRQGRIIVVLNIPLVVAARSQQGPAHWVVFSFDRNAHEITAYDSAAVATLPLEEIGLRIGKSINTGPWSFSNPVTVPRQNNTNDCGVYALVSIFHLMCGRSVVGSSCYAPLWRFLFKQFLKPDDELNVREWIVAHVSSADDAQHPLLWDRQRTFSAEVHDAVANYEILRLREEGINAFLDKTTYVVRLCEDLCRIAKCHQDGPRRQVTEIEGWKMFSQWMADMADSTGLAQQTLQQCNELHQDGSHRLDRIHKAQKAHAESTTLYKIARQILDFAKDEKEKILTYRKELRAHITAIWRVVKSSTDELGEWLVDNP